MQVVLILMGALLISAAAAAGAGFPGAKDYVVNGCRVFSPDQMEIKALPGDRCVFLDKGSFVTTMSESIRYYTATNEMKWEIKGHFHHQLNLSHDRQRLLAIGSTKAAMNGENEKRYDQLLVIGLSGKVLNSLDVNKAFELMGIKSTNYPNPYQKLFPVEHEGSHINSFYEIGPLNNGARKPAYIREGHYILNGIAQGVIFLDKDLKAIKHWVSPYSNRHNVHDAQITSGGRLIYFNNQHVTDNWKTQFSTIDEIDLATSKLSLQIKANPASLFFSRHSGGVQVLDRDLVLFSHAVSGYYVYSRRSKQIVYMSTAPYFTGSNYTFAQQVKVVDLTEFLK